ELDGDSQLPITDQIQKAQLPQQVFSVESWVRVDRTQTWGGIIGVIQDNGNFERGWLLGFSDSQFCLAVKGEQNQGGMTYLKSSTKFETEQWYHLAGTYDGKEMKVYVNGKLSASSKNQQGDIHYPEKTFYEIGAYHDENERYPMKGMLREIRLYDRLLNADEIADHSEDYHFNIPVKTVPISLAAGPILEFTSPGTAIVTWKTYHPVPTHLSYSLDSIHEKEISDSSPTTEHTVKLTGLHHNRIYHYVIHVTEGSAEGKTKAFECDTFFNFTAKNPQFNESDYFSATLQNPYVDVADEILNLSETRKGICLLIGVQNGRLAYELARRSELQVIGIDTDKTKVTQGRKRLAKAGIYGNKTSFYYFENGEIPYIQQCANLIVVTNPQVSKDLNSFAEYLKPGSGKLLLQKSRKQPVVLQTSADLVFLEATESWTGFQKNAKKGIGNWTHQYGTPANAAYAGESLQGASAATDFQVQWIGRPGPRAQPDRNGRKPSPLVANGRLYVQGLQRIISLDTYNGTVLWSKEIPPLQRFNMPRDSSNWCADDANLYAAIKNECWKFDGQTGRILNTIPTVPAEGNTEPMDWGYISVQNDLIIGSSVKKGTAFTEYWGGSNAGWYDATSGPATDKACSQNLFAIDSSDATRKWNYQDGIILNATITGGDSMIYFVECRHPKVKEHPSGRIGIPELWKNLFLVAIDRESGNKKWEKPIHPEQGIVVFYLAYGSEKLVLLSSGKKQYNLYTFDGNNGKPDWVQSFPWTKDNHGAHMARPAIVGQTIYVRPKAVDLITGKFLDIPMPGGGCGTYAATDQALFFRAGNVTVWDRNSGNTTSWNRLRPDCWLSTIPADGLLLSPEAGGGCSCGSWMETSIAFSPIMQ
ncbi:MAG TPA: hypothetical protein EYQ50_06890, partial [Verrucomicrobiales bacterium]|nr:hypothetical protein [Verrucomicrobiales bacterium]